MQVQHRLKRADPVIDLPNLVEIQLDSYQWFLKEGLIELFRSFSPIHDFTGNLALELVDYTLGDPKYSVEECRNRDMTFEAPIKAIVRLSVKDQEVIESEVYLGDLPLMTERGTFVINGAERVVVSQLARSPGVYFKDTMDLSGRVLYYATIIPNEGAWVEVDTDSNNVITVRIGQTRKFPLTTLLRALNHFEKACPMVEAEVPLLEAVGYELIDDLVDLNTGEVLIEKGRQVRPREASRAKKAGAAEMVKIRRQAVPCDTTKDILEIFSERETLHEITRATLRNKRPVNDIPEAKGGKIIGRSCQKIGDEAAKKI